MTLARLALRGLRFFWRSHLGVLIGAVIATAVLAGALAVGDSVRYSLKRAALARLGGTHLALHNPGRFFRAALAGEVSAGLDAPTVPVLLLRGTALGQLADGTDAGLRAGRVQVVGANDDLWRLGGATAPPALTTPNGEDGVAVNERLARALGVRIGDDVLLRVDKPSLLSRDAPLATVEDATVTLRLPVTAVVGEEAFGAFSLEANQIPPYNAFVGLPVLQRAVGMEARANTLLAGTRTRGTPPAPADATGALWKSWQFADAGLTLRPVPDRPDTLELRSDRVFLEPPVADAARTAQPGAMPALTYFVNGIRRGARETPYSTVAALPPGVGPVPAGMRENEVVLNDWLAADLGGAKPGEKITLRYWLVGPMRRLEEHSADFTVRAVVPLNGPARDPALMPDIPGLSDKKDCREWEPGVPIDLERIRDKDQAYWSAHRGTPKAFLTLPAGQRIWDNRFGNLTTVRYPAPPGGRETVEACLRQALSPASLGLFFQPVRERALAAGAQGLDFGQLFLGLSLFLIVAALLLTALLFALGTERRAAETGTLLALGVPPGRVRRLLLLEGGLIALCAVPVGLLLATLFTRAVVAALGSVWGGAVAGANLAYHAEPSTLAAGGAASFLLALFSIFLVARRQARAPARALLASGGESDAEWLSAPKAARRYPPGLPTALVTGVLALGLVGATVARPGAAGAFFGAGALLLIAGLAVCRAFLDRWRRADTGDVGNAAPNVAALGIRSAARRPARALGTVALFACGAFLVVAVGANRHDAGADADRRGAGTGGFAFYGESSLPVFHDLNAPDGRDAYALDPAALGGVDVVALRLREGDDASCLNLNRAQTPRLLGVDPRRLASRDAFAFAQQASGGDAPGWARLDRPQPDGAIPVVGDTNTVVWSLGKKVGDTLPYTDERGNTHRLRIVGVLGNSVLQGALLLSEADFTRLFPGHSGYQAFLIDAPPDAAARRAAGAELTRGLEDVGLSLTPTADRMAAFQTVENTYLTIFAALGGLGLLLGGAGLGVVAARNVWERRSELALLRAVGWRGGTLQTLIFAEHALLLALGLAVGVGAALVAVLPALRSPGAAASAPVASLALTLAAVFAGGLLWAWAATAAALRRPLLASLRDE